MKPDGTREVGVYYSYEEERAYLDITYDEQSNEITIRAGRHGFAYLAEMASIYALAPADTGRDDWHFSPLVHKEPQFTMNFVPDLRKGR